MDKKKKGVIFVILLVLLLVYVSRKNATSSSYEKRYRDSIVTTNAEINTLLEKTKLNAFIQDSLTLSRFVSEGGVKLILRLTDSQCNACIDMQYLLLSKYMQDMKQQIVVIGTTSGRSNYKGRKFVGGIIEIPDSLLSWEPEFYNAPYYFVLHPDLTVSHFFVPDKHYEDLSKSYLEEVRHLIKEK